MEMLTSTSVVSGDALANEETLPTNETAPGAAMRPIRRYNSLISGTGAPAAGISRGSGSRFTRVVEAELQATAVTEPRIRE
jgi:hypothetical protein